MPAALLNGTISTYNLKLIARNEGILPMLIAVDDKQQFHYQSPSG